MTISVQCNICGEIIEIEVPESGYKAWIEGALIQKALPEVPIDYRELMISGTCGPCFDKLFPEEENE